MTKYSFNFQNAGSSIYLVYAFLTAVCLLTLVIIADMDSIFLFLIALFAPFVFGFYLFVKRGKASDCIVLDDLGFTSSYHGRVDYEAIDSIPPFGLLGAPPPSMKIKLKSGKKINWYLAFTGNTFHKAEDAQTFQQFTADLERHLAAYLGRESSALAPKQALLADTEKIPIENTAPPLYRPLDQIKEVNARNNKKMWAIPLSLILGLSAFIKTCGTDYIREKKNRDVRAIFETSERHYAENMQKSKELLDEVLKKEGAIYLYSNDTGKITARLLPDIEDNQLLERLPVLHRADISRKLDHFIKYPDSAVYKTVLIKEDSSIFAMEKSILNHGDSTGTFLYLRFYDPTRKVKPYPAQGRATSDSTQMKTFEVSTGVSISSDRSIEESLEKSMLGLSMLLAQVNHSPSFKIYLSGAQKDKVSEELFNKVVTVLNKKLANVKVDTATFRYSVHGL